MGRDVCAAAAAAARAVDPVRRTARAADEAARRAVSEEELAVQHAQAAVMERCAMQVEFASPDDEYL